MGSPLTEALRGGSRAKLPTVSVGILVYLATISVATMLLVKEIGSRCYVETVGGMISRLPAIKGDSSHLQREVVVLAMVQGLPEAHVKVDRALGRFSSMPSLNPALPSPMLAVALKLAARDAASPVRDGRRKESEDAQIVVGTAQLEPARQLMIAVNELALLVQCVLIGALCASVLLSMLSQFDASDKTVELMYLLGADDATIIEMSMCAALRTALAGGLTGSAMAMITVVTLLSITFAPLVALAPIFSLSAAAWSAIVLLPGVAAVSAMFAAWIATRRALASMP